MTDAVHPLEPSQSLQEPATADVRSADEGLALDNLDVLERHRAAGRERRVRERVHPALRRRHTVDDIAQLVGNADPAERHVPARGPLAVLPDVALAPV